MWEDPWKNAKKSEDSSSVLTFVLLEERFRELGLDMPWIIFHHWNWQDPRIVETPCPKCGSAERMVCFYAESGDPNTFYDEFYHVCLKCGNIQHTSEYGGSVGYEDHADCPYCQHRWA